MTDTMGEMNYFVEQLLVAVWLLRIIELDSLVITGQGEVPRRVKRTRNTQRCETAGDDRLAWRMAEQRGVQNRLGIAGVRQQDRGLAVHTRRCYLADGQDLLRGAQDLGRERHRISPKIQQRPTRHVRPHDPMLGSEMLAVIGKDGVDFTEHPVREQLPQHVELRQEVGPVGFH